MSACLFSPQFLINLIILCNLFLVVYFENDFYIKQISLFFLSLFPLSLFKYFRFFEENFLIQSFLGKLFESFIEIFVFSS